MSSMRTYARTFDFGRFLLQVSLAVLAPVLILGGPALHAQRTMARAALNITGYDIDAEIDPATHNLKATAVVSFVPPPNQDVVTFGFHPALKITAINDDNGK